MENSIILLSLKPYVQGADGGEDCGADGGEDCGADGGEDGGADGGEDCGADGVEDCWAYGVEDCGEGTGPGDAPAVSLKNSLTIEGCSSNLYSWICILEKKKVINLS